MREKAILFDMDGVLVDSEAVITEASILALREYGIQPVEADFKPFTGMGEDAFVGGPAEKHGLRYIPEMKNRAYEYYLELVDEKIGLYPETAQTLLRLRESGLRLAVASAADRIKVNANLKAAGISLDWFEAIITGSDVERKKPFPDIYLLAAERIGMAPTDCLVVEDALSGLQAAHSAGCRCLCVETSFDRRTLLEAGANAVCPVLRDIFSTELWRRG